MYLKERYTEEDFTFKEATEEELNSMEMLPVPLEDPNEERDRIWERNHQMVLDSIAIALKNKGPMPSISYIVERTRLNRKTVRKHLNEFSNTPAFKEHKVKYSMMVTRIMDTLLEMALNHNVRAARLYMELMGMLKTNQAVNNNFINCSQQNIQINGVPITEEKIKALSPEDEMLVEGIFRMTGKGMVATSGHNSGGQKQ